MSGSDSEIDIDDFGGCIHCKGIDHLTKYCEVCDSYICSPCYMDHYIVCGQIEVITSNLEIEKENVIKVFGNESIMRQPKIYNSF